MSMRLLHLCLLSMALFSNVKAMENVSSAELKMFRSEQQKKQAKADFLKLPVAQQKQILADREKLKARVNELTMKPTKGTAEKNAGQPTAAQPPEQPKPILIKTQSMSETSAKNLTQQHAEKPKEEPAKKPGLERTTSMPNQLPKDSKTAEFEGNAAKSFQANPNKGYSKDDATAQKFQTDPAGEKDFSRDAGKAGDFKSDDSQPSGFFSRTKQKVKDWVKKGEEEFRTDKIIQQTKDEAEALKKTQEELKKPEADYKTATDKLGSTKEAASFVQASKETAKLKNELEEIKSDINSLDTQITYLTNPQSSLSPHFKSDKTTTAEQKMIDALEVKKSGRTFDQALVNRKLVPSEKKTAAAKDAFKKTNNPEVDDDTIKTFESTNTTLVRAERKHQKAEEAYTKKLDDAVEGTVSTLDDVLNDENIERAAKGLGNNIGGMVVLGTAAITSSLLTGSSGDAPATEGQTSATATPEEIDAIFNPATEPVAVGGAN
ncbi:MAG: hypothetical protein WCT20_01905 [Candidatus Babeliales bacterium]